ncbi:MAG TPA: DNA gyrase inhibitor YacG [Candidatus Acidoferrum sp.]|nr:DNA gyrase inhibitor YacG [Candidatus Acidoferrum sp.]
MKHRCPICKSPIESEVDREFPFCSERCRILDLGAWASEKYVVSDPIFDEEELAEADRTSQAVERDKRNETIH